MKDKHLSNKLSFEFEFILFVKLITKHHFFKCYISHFLIYASPHDDAVTPCKVLHQEATELLTQIQTQTQKISALWRPAVRRRFKPVASSVPKWETDLCDTSSFSQPPWDEEAKRGTTEITWKSTAQVENKGRDTAASWQIW